MVGASRIDWRLGSPNGVAMRGAAAVACLASLDAPEMAPLWGLDPTKQDLEDERYPGASGRDRFLERRALLRALVAGQTDTPASEVIVAYDEAGAPVIRDPRSGLRVTVAGRDELAAVAIAFLPVGIDIEPLIDLEPVEAVLHPHESARLASTGAGSPGRAFLHIWTMKEAYLKALRTGLRREPVEIEIEAIDETAARIIDGGRPVKCVAEWKRATISGREVIAACVVLEG